MSADGNAEVWSDVMRLTGAVELGLYVDSASREKSGSIDSVSRSRIEDCLQGAYRLNREGRLGCEHMVCQGL
jgi:hypothetical protein